MNLPRSRTFAGLLDEMAERFGERNFVTDRDRRLSYAQFRAEVRQLAKGLHALGVRRDDKVALIMGNQAEWLVADFAVTLLGGILVAVNTWWKQGELQHALASTDTSVLLMVDSYLGNDYTAALAGIGDLAQACPQLRAIVGLGERLPAGALRYEDLLARGRAVSDGELDAAQRAVQPDDTAYLLFTSGSTSRSKAVRLTHRGCIENCHGIGENMHLTEQDRMLVPTSMFWSFSCVNALFAVLTHGGSLVLLFKYDTGEMLRAIEEEGCTGAYTLPNIVLALYEHPGRRQRDLSRWRTGICRSNLIERMAEIGPREMITGYGLTECYGHSVQTDGRAPPAERIRNCGRPLPGVEMKVIDPATGAEVPRGTAGEILLRGHVTPGYYGDAQRTHEAIDAAGWFHTGDVGFVEEDGTLAFKGRFKELIKTGGINVSPADVEEVLLAHPAVQQAVVVGVPDASRDEIVAALVVARPGASVDADTLVAHCRRTAAVFKVPRFLQVVRADEVPLTDTGKVHKGRAQELLARRYRAAAQEEKA
jgi:fatty-acyl-CoA synthase